jgi:hypothetical protein
MRWSRIPIGLAVVLVGIQLVPVARTHPAPEAKLGKDDRALLSSWARGSQE